MYGSLKVLRAHDEGNVIEMAKLKKSKITPEELNEFLDENNLVWSSFKSGSVLGDVAMFYHRSAEDQIGNTRAQNIQGREPISGEEYIELKKKYALI